MVTVFHHVFASCGRCGFCADCLARIATALTLSFGVASGYPDSFPMSWLRQDEASWVTLVSINLLKLNWCLIIELNPSSCKAKDSRILSLARNFFLMLSLICFWPYMKSLSEGWKLLLKLLPYCRPKGRSGLEFQPCWDRQSESFGVLFLLEFSSSWVNGQDLPDCPCDTSGVKLAKARWLV